MEEEKRHIQLPKGTTPSEIRIWNSSANVLCKYMRKPEHLYEIIDNLAIIPRYNEEIVDYLQVPSIYSLSLPMICFCDIPLNRAHKHSEQYGSYGIALDKNIISSNNIQPILYMNPDSKLCSNFAEVFRNLLNDEEIEAKWKYLPNFMITLLCYSKPITGKMGGKNDVLFQDECEWRFVPRLPEDMELLLLNERNTESGRDKYNEALRMTSNSESWLRFSFDSIEYLIVPDQRAALELIDHILSISEEKYSDNEKHKLISKIEVYDRIKLNYN